MQMVDQLVNTAIQQQMSGTIDMTQCGDATLQPEVEIGTFFLSIIVSQFSSIDDCLVRGFTHISQFVKKLDDQVINDNKIVSVGGWRVKPH